MTHTRFSRKPFDKSFNNFVDDVFAEFPVLFKNNGQQTWNNAPANITEKENSYVLEIVAPGFEKTDFKVNLDQQVLTVAVEKKEETKSENEKQIRKEYSYRSFKRSFTLDEKIDAAGINAAYVNGVLTLTLPKKENIKQAAQEIAIS